jgi:flagellar hook protein FlgE
MVLKAMYSGVSGLRAEGEALGVVGDNIANANTVGFKAQRAIFQDVLGHSILAGTGTNLPGSGVKIGDIQQLFTQGTLTTTGISTDVALSGEGFFTVKGSVNGLSGNFFTRAGQFVLDASGNLVNPGGLKVQGYAANGDGTFAASLSDVKAPTSAIPARATQEAFITANLNSTTPRVSVTDPLTGAVTYPAFDAQQPATTSSFSDTLTVYDSLGAAHTIDVYFRKEADPTGAPPTTDWSWFALTSGDQTDLNGGGVAGQNNQLATGTLQFDSNGALIAGSPSSFSVTYDGATAQNIVLNMGTILGTADPVTGAVSDGLDGITQFASPSNVSSHSQDGYAAGDFSGIAIDGTGVVQGLYTNGEKLDLAQLAIAKFQSNDGLGRAGESLWIDTRESGQAAYGTAGSGGRGATSAGAVEASNVDLAEEFVGLIQHQRSFSANSKTITTADEMLQELINIKR